MKKLQNEKISEIIAHLDTLLQELKSHYRNGEDDMIIPEISVMKSFCGTALEMLEEENDG